jgi:hypothetical protein
MKATTVHALQQQQVTTRIDDGAGNGNTGLCRHGDGGRQHSFCARRCEALAVGNIHPEKIRKTWA